MYKLHLSAFIILGVGQCLLFFAVKPVERGFFCDDESIRFPYNSKASINYLVLAVLCYSLALFSFICNAFHSKNIYAQTTLDLVPFTFGYMVNLFFLSLTQTATGRLRPYFIEFCTPNIMEQCYDAQTGKLRRGVYIEQFQCNHTTTLATKNDWFTNMDARQSFYSGHSCISAYAMLYLIIYVQKHMCTLSVLWRALIQYILLIFSLLCSYSCITDYHHHCSDVIVGLLAGSIIAVGTHYAITPYYCQQQQVKQPSDQSGSESNDDHTEQQPFIQHQHKRISQRRLVRNCTERNLEWNHLIEEEHPFYQTV